MKIPSELQALAVIAITAVTAVLVRPYRLYVILGGLCVLIVMLLVQAVSTRRKRSPTLPAKWHVVGECHLSTELFVTDTWKFSRGEHLAIPNGTYKILVRTDDDGSGEPVVGAIRLVNPVGSRPRESQIAVSVDSGFLLFLDRARVEPETAERVAKRTLGSKGVRAAILPDASGTACGVMVESGLGDGIYDVRITASDEGAEISTDFC